MYSSSFFMPSTWRTLDTILTVSQCKADQSENSSEILVQLPMRTSFKIPLWSPGTSVKHLMLKCRWVNVLNIERKKWRRKAKEEGRRESKTFWDFLARCTDKKKLVHVVRPASNGVPFVLSFFFFRADTGFRRVGPKEYKPRLLQFNDEVHVNVLNFCVWWILINIQQFHYYNKNEFFGTRSVAFLLSKPFTLPQCCTLILAYKVLKTC